MSGIASRVRLDAVIARLPDVGLPAAGWQVGPVLSDSIRTSVRAITSPFTDVSLAIKMVEPDRVDGLVRDFAAQKEIVPVVPAEALHLPRPVAAFPDLGAMVSTRVPGQTLRICLRNAKTPWPEALVRNAGQALAGFHRALHQTDRRIDQRGHAQKLTRAADDVAFIPHRLWLREMSDTHRQATEAIRGVLMPFGMTHGDLCLRNVLVDGDQVGLVDFEFAQPACQWADLARLSVRMFHEGRRRPALDIHPLSIFERKVMNPLMDGYGLPADMRTPFRVFVLRMSLLAWVEMGRTKATISSLFARWQMQRLATSLAQKLAETLGIDQVRPTLSMSADPALQMS